MKNVALSVTASLFLLSSINAATLKKESIRVSFEGYKTEEMVGVKGEFKNIQYKLGKDTKSIAGTLKGASAIIAPNSVDMEEGNEEITKNIINAFFATLLPKNGNVQVNFRDVVEGNNKGVISAQITIENQSTIIPLTYMVNNNKFEAHGQLDLHVFNNANKALKALSDAAPGHGGISWPLVDIVVTADIQK